MDLRLHTPNPNVVKILVDGAATEVREEVEKCLILRLQFLKIFIPTQWNIFFQPF